MASRGRPGWYKLWNKGYDPCYHYWNGRKWACTGGGCLYSSDTYANRGHTIKRCSVCLRRRSLDDIVEGLLDDG